MEEGIMTFAPQQPIKVVKEKKEAFSRINELEEELLEQERKSKETISEMSEII